MHRETHSKVTVTDAAREDSQSMMLCNGMDRPAISDQRLPKWVVIGALWAWFLVVLLTHYGARSPYSYAGGVLGMDMRRIDGVVVNHDAPSVRPVTEFFYDARPVKFSTAHNLKLPLHSMLVAAAASYLRSYLLANYVVNLLALWLLSYVVVTFADSLGFPRGVTLLASLTCAALPVWATYVGQPMHYVLGIVVNFLVVIAVMSGPRDPWRLGLLTAILTMSYDPYVYIGAVICWIAHTVRWQRVLDWAIYTVSSVTPVLAWRGFLGVVSDAPPSGAIRDSFFVPVFDGWRAIVMDPFAHLLTPFINGHVGVSMSVAMLLAIASWPVVLVCVAGLATIPPVRGRAFSLPALLALLFVLEQIATAAYDWENNPRRALPLLFAFCCFYFVVLRERMPSRTWRVGFAAALLICLFVTMSDTLLRNPVIGYIPTGEAMRAAPKDVLKHGAAAIDPTDYPRLMGDARARWWSMSGARVTRPWILLFANLLVGAVVVALLQVLRERALVPRRLPAIVGVLVAVSLVVRLM